MQLARTTPNMENHHVWLEMEHLQSLGGFNFSAFKEDALFFVVRDVAVPPIMVRWTVVLQGGFVIDASHLQGLRGATFAYSPALGTETRVLISPKLQSQCPVLARVIMSVCSFVKVQFPICPMDWNIYIHLP